MQCKSCHGLGLINGAPCIICQGGGIAICLTCGGYGQHSGEDGPEEKCGDCSGTGYADEAVENAMSKPASD